MSLLAPLFLLGLGLLALPIWLHRLQTDDPVRESFASTMFLEPSQKRVHVRKQIQHLLLLAIRLLFLALLVFAFVRPALKLDSPLAVTASNRMHLVVIDTTASMSSSTAFEKARDEAMKIVDAAENGDLIQLYRFGPNLSQETDPIFDKSMIRNAIERLRPTPVYGDAGNMMGALSRLDWSQPLDYQVHIVSDLQKTALPNRYADMIPDIPASAHIAFNFYPVAMEDRSNWFIESVREEDLGLRIAVRGINTPESDLDIGLEIGDNPEIRLTLRVPESGRATLFVPAISYEAGINKVRARLLGEDALTADNDFHLVVDRSPAEPVLLLTDNPYAPAANYLSAVMASVGQASPNASAYRVEAVSLSELDPRTLERYSWLLIDDIGSIDESLADALQSYLESGGALFSALGEQATRVDQLPVTGHQVPAEEIVADNSFQTVAQVDQSHQILNGLEGWSNLSFSRSVDIDLHPEDKVLVRLSNGHPLLVEQQKGQGKLLLFASSLDNTWNDLPVKPLYVSLMTQIAEYLSDSDRLKSQLFGGDTFSLRDVTGGAAQLVDPQEQAALSLGNTNRPGTHIMDKTGFYQVFSTAGETSIGVNVSPLESDLTPIEDVELERWKQTINGQSEKDVTGDDSVLVQQNLPQRELWFGLLCAALLLLWLESLLANKQIVTSAGRAAT